MFSLRLPEEGARTIQGDKQRLLVSRAGSPPWVPGLRPRVPSLRPRVCPGISPAAFDGFVLHSHAWVSLGLGLGLGLGLVRVS